MEGLREFKQAVLVLTPAGEGIKPYCAFSFSLGH